MKEENSAKHPLENAIDNYITHLNSQMGAFPIIMNTLAAKTKASAEKLTKFIKDNNINVDDNNECISISLPVNLAKQFVKYNSEVEQSFLALELTPKNVVVALVSIYDAYLAEIIQTIYKLKPEMLKSCNKEYLFSELLEFDSLDEIKEHVIEKEVETILRENHAKQLEILEKKICTSLTTGLHNFKDFIEITERRNLFVHTNGKISRQYKKKCSPREDQNENPEIGTLLTASPEYIKHSYNILFEIGVKLSQVIWRKFDNKNTEDADNSLIEIIFDLLKDRKYKLAIELAEFSTQDYIKPFNAEHKYIFIINKALSYYLADDIEKSRTIMDSIDWSANDTKYKLAYAILTNNYNEACELMSLIPDKQSIKESYRDWPLFTKFRESNDFKKAYRDIYNEEFELIEIKPIDWETVIEEAQNINKEMKEYINSENAMTKKSNK